jgi:hypothetical protein
MTTQPDDQPGGLTRRQIIAGAGAAAAGAAVLGAGLPGRAGASAPAAVPQAVAPAIPGLTYKSIDGVAFDVAETTTNRRIWQDITGIQPLTPNAWIYTSLDLPVGAVVKQVSAVYQGQPIVSIRERAFATGAIPDVFTPTSMTASPGGAFASTTEITPAVTIKADCSYQLRFFCTAGVSIMGATVGYSPASFSSIVPKRVLDTRLGIGAPVGRIQPNEEKVVDLSGAAPFGSAAVLGVTVDQPQGGGFLAVYSADVANPGTSNLNYSPVTPAIASSAIVTMGAGNKIKVFCGVAATDVIIDVVGYLL